MKYLETLEKAARSSNPYVELEREIKELLGQGVEREELLEVLLAIVFKLREDDLEELEDIVLDFMDSLSHWGNPANWL